MTTAYHAKYFAHELTKRCPSDSVQKFAASLANAQVDLNPHQVEAALFAFRSPLTKGAILADEVGLGKTIEAGILLSQKWAERKRKLLIIVPSNLRKQWNQELMDKFFLPSVILEKKSFEDAIKDDNLNPFEQSSIVICSYHFARSKDVYIRKVKWDLVVIDEAHRLRNVYKPSNKIANTIKRSLADFPKVLLTATPLQNSLLELFGLVSIIDDHTFGDLKSFKGQFAKLSLNGNFDELKKRLQPVCKRTLRRQVMEYIKYTNRIPITQEFVPSSDEQKLYDLVSDYLQKPNLFALPPSQRQLMTLILRKLLASSTYAIAGTLQALVDKLEDVARQKEVLEIPLEEVTPDIENVDELEEEWVDDAEDDETQKKKYTSEELKQINEEIKTLKEFHRLAKSIAKNSKGEVLLTALKKGFDRAREQGGSQKAIIFTESTRTQEYLRELLEKTEYTGKIVLFNGSNQDKRSKEIYRQWLKKHEGTDRITGSHTADIRAALVDYFRDEAVIMIATEAASEGINLQFCSLVVNYDLPWNPQRIEQRIGRCHRYGQKYDVVVVNFLNKKNAADQRVYQLLFDKFKLFEGVFGASDEVLGIIESGVDFEKRIAQIYQTCRTEEAIQLEFDSLQKELEVEIGQEIESTRKKLLENFDEEVHEKLRLNLKESHEALDKFEGWLWQMTRYYLSPYAKFEENANSFVLTKNPFPEEKIHPGPYRAGKNVEDANLYRIGHPLAQRIIDCCKSLSLDPAELEFQYTKSDKKITILDPLKGKSGWLMVTSLTLSALEVEDHLLLAGISDDGKAIDADQCQRLFSLRAAANAASNGKLADTTRRQISDLLARQKNQIVEQIKSKNGTYFEIEVDKLDSWADDQRNSLKLVLKEMDEQIKEIKKQARLAPNLPEKLKLEREKQQLDAKRDKAWKEHELAFREIESRKDALMDDIEKRLNQKITETPLFTIRWRIT